MNRTETTTAIIWLEQLIAQAKSESGKLRDQLGADAKAELDEHGVAPTWRIPDVATISLAVSKQTVYVSDEVAFAAWVQQRYPEQTEVKVRPAWTQVFTERHVLVEPEGLTDSATGEIVPGLAVRPGGLPMSLTIRPSADAKAVFAAVAETSLRKLALEAGPSMPVVLAELEATDARP